MSIDWDNIEKESNANSQFKKMATKGNHTTAVDKVELGQVTASGSYPVNFFFQETETEKFPRGTHWISFKNDSWRCWHFKCLMEVLGATEANAKKAVEACESKSGNETKAKMYAEALNKLASKHASVEVVVREQYDKDGNVRTYEFENDNGDTITGERLEAEFTDPRVFMVSNKPKTASEVPATSTDTTSEDEIDLSDVPF